MVSNSPGGLIFGWAKPVPVNPNNMSNPRRDMMFVGAAGPLANFVLAGIASLILHTAPELKAGYIGLILQMLVVYNIILPVFNLIPIPPLDGSPGVLRPHHAG